MIPRQDKIGDLLTEGIEEEILPSLTHKMHIEEESIGGFVDDREALKQAIYKEINTEPDVYPIYNYYGVKKEDLFGKPKPYAFVEISRRIEEALILDDRILKVYGFFYHKDRSTGSKLVFAFKVDSIFGELEIKKVEFWSI